MKRHLNTLTEALFTYHLEEDTPALVGVCCVLLQLMGLICLPLLWLAYYTGCAVLWLYHMSQLAYQHIASAPPSSLTGGVRDGLNRLSRRAGKIVLTSIEGIRDEIPHALATANVAFRNIPKIPRKEALTVLTLTLTGTLFATILAHWTIPTIAITSTLVIAYLANKYQESLTDLIVPKR